MKEKGMPESIQSAIIDYCKNNLKQEQADELLLWIEKDKENQKSFTETVNIWNATKDYSKKRFDAEEAWSKLNRRIRVDKTQPHFGGHGKIVHLRLWWLMAAAGVFLLLIASGILIYFAEKPALPLNSFYEAVAPKGSRLIITLADGSNVWLNSGTSVKYDAGFGISSRNIYLEGEAYFVVSKNKDIPFKVKTSDITVTALGTAFNIKAYKEENVIETTLENGEIRIDQTNINGKPVRNASVFLKQNQKAVYLKDIGNLSLNENINEVTGSKKGEDLGKNILTIKIDTLVDTKLTTSWKDNKWIFKSEKLDKLAPILERRYDVSIIFMDSVNNYKFTGTIKEESLDQVLNVLCMAAPVKYEIRQNLVYFSMDTKQQNKYRKKSDETK
jgi:ferric-dicitrate binding protein FerR (iron transport regulator)